jgi:hypothetical protein
MKAKVKTKVKLKEKRIPPGPSHRMMHELMEYIHYYLIDEIEYEERQEEEKKKLAAKKRRLARKCTLTCK